MLSCENPQLTESKGFRLRHPGLWAGTVTGRAGRSRPTGHSPLLDGYVWGYTDLKGCSGTGAHRPTQLARLRGCPRSSCQRRDSASSVRDATAARSLSRMRDMILRITMLSKVENSFSGAADT